jgi:glycosyltransferase involved in cell wall biosynthesis
VRIAVGVCTVDRNELLRGCLAAIATALRSQPPAAEVAVFVVDNHPAGLAAELVKGGSGEFPAPLEYLHETQRGISFARNRAVDAARAWGADAIAFVDDDDLPRPDWLARLVAPVAAEGAQLVLGGWDWEAGFALRPWQRDLKSLRPARLDRRNAFGVPAGAGTYNVLIGRALIDHLVARDGFVFDPELALSGGSDTDLFIRAIRGGAPLAVARDSIVCRRFEPGRLTFRGLWRRQLRSGSSQAHHERRWLDPAARAESARKQRRHLRRALVRTPLALWPPRRAANHLLRIARLAGYLRAQRSERRSRYYAELAERSPS